MVHPIEWFTSKLLFNKNQREMYKTQEELVQEIRTKWKAPHTLNKQNEQNELNK